jgi:integrase
LSTRRGNPSRHGSAGRATLLAAPTGTDDWDASRFTKKKTASKAATTKPKASPAAKPKTGSTIERTYKGVQHTVQVADVTPETIRRGLTGLSRGGASPTTVNGYRLSVSGFFAWLVREGRWPTNPVKQVAPVKVNGKVRERRALTEEELRRLLEAAPPHRALVYRVAATTGLRRGELAALRWADVDLEAATLRVRATTSKNRREAFQPLPAGTVAALKATRGKQQFPSAPVLGSVPGTPTLRKDLAAAKIPFETEEGVVDFHALRVTYATMLARAGVGLVQAQRLMRHSTPTLTANIYTRLRLDDGHAAVAKIDLDAGDSRSPGPRARAGS